MSEQPYERVKGPVHEWFGLSYSNYLVLPRVLMQSMPLEWQHRMVACLREIDEAFEHVDRPTMYHVEPAEWLAPFDMDQEQMRRAGVTMEYDEDLPSEDSGVTYYDRDSNELDPEIGRVPVPVVDPLPHYRHGYVEPSIPSAESGAEAS